MKAAHHVSLSVSLCLLIFSSSTVGDCSSKSSRMTNPEYEPKSLTRFSVGSFVSRYGTSIHEVSDRKTEHILRHVEDTGIDLDGYLVHVEKAAPEKCSPSQPSLIIWVSPISVGTLQALKKLSVVAVLPAYWQRTNADFSPEVLFGLASNRSRIRVQGHLLYSKVATRNLTKWTIDPVTHVFTSQTFKDSRDSWEVVL